MMKRILIFILISIALHTLLLAIKISSDPLRSGRKNIKVSLVDVKKTKKHVEKEKEINKDDDLKGQIVDLPPSDSERPDKADFLSETNHKVEKESISRHRKLSNEKSGYEQTTDKRIESQSFSLGDGNKDLKPKKMEAPRVGKKEELSLQLNDLGSFKNSLRSDDLYSDGKYLQLKDGDSDIEQERGGNKDLNLFPDQKTLSRIASSPFSDHVDNVEEGEGTFLNTIEFKYASFFNRVKRDIANFWKPIKELRRRDPTGNIYGFRNRVTILSVVLDLKGNVVSATVIESSGVDFIDKEAVAAFHRAGQFINPPKGLIKNGKIRFDFGFHIGFGRGRMFF